MRHFRTITLPRKATEPIVQPTTFWGRLAQALGLKTF
jgi:hypothetical protein